MSVVDIGGEVSDLLLIGVGWRSVYQSLCFSGIKLDISF